MQLCIVERNVKVFKTEDENVVTISIYRLETHSTTSALVKIIYCDDMSTSEYIVLLFSAISVTWDYNHCVLDMILKWNLLLRGPHWKVMSSWQTLQVEDIIHCRWQWLFSFGGSMISRQTALNQLKAYIDLYQCVYWHKIMSWILSSDLPEKKRETHLPLLFP